MEGVVEPPTGDDNHLCTKPAQENTEIMMYEMLKPRNHDIDGECYSCQMKYEINFNKPYLGMPRGFLQLWIRDIEPG